MRQRIRHMKHLTANLLTFLLLFLSGCASTNIEISSSIPASVSNVQTELMGDNIVRVIQHNMELNPILQVELLSRPNFKPINALTIRALPFNNAQLSLQDSSGAFVESISIEESHIDIVFDYFYLHGGSLLLSCRLTVKKSLFSPLDCHRK